MKGDEEEKKRNQERMKLMQNDRKVRIQKDDENKKKVEELTVGEWG